MVMTILQATITPASDQVSLSMNSFVFFTPPNCAGDPKSELNPPPFGFCMKITRVSSIAAMIIIIER